MLLKVNIKCGDRLLGSKTRAFICGVSERRLARLENNSSVTKTLLGGEERVLTVGEHDIRTELWRVMEACADHHLQPLTASVLHALKSPCPSPSPRSPITHRVTPDSFIRVQLPHYPVALSVSPPPASSCFPFFTFIFCLFLKIHSPITATFSFLFPSLLPANTLLSLSAVSWSGSHLSQPFPL